jgi:hypothetical protein
VDEKEKELPKKNKNKTLDYIDRQIWMFIKIENLWHEFSVSNIFHNLSILE